MDQYCLEIPENNSSRVIHNQECRSFDLASKLGEGRVISLGEFDNSSQAFKAVLESNRRDVIRCQNCCDTGVKYRSHKNSSRQLLPLVVMAGYMESQKY